jgi:hypothetical protein
MNGFKAVRRFEETLQLEMVPESRRDKITPRLKVINYQDAERHWPASRRAFADFKTRMGNYRMHLELSFIVVSDKALTLS